jgi:hypothetical protein
MANTCLEKHTKKNKNKNKTKQGHLKKKKSEIKRVEHEIPTL